MIRFSLHTVQALWTHRDLLRISTRQQLLQLTKVGRTQRVGRAEVLSLPAGQHAIAMDHPTRPSQWRASPHPSSWLCSQ